MNISPLRYPGGKSCLYQTIAELLRLNKLELTHYAEPYAGGCGLALALLVGGHVSHIHINDIDESIWAFWHSVLFKTDQFIKKIDGTEVSIKEWDKQKSIISSPKKVSTLNLGFAAFFLNRTNRSGVIKNAGMIGGKDQDGKYKIDCRFNKKDLSARIKRISLYKNRISLYKKDAIDFISNKDKSLPSNTFFCIDPPYYNKGASLYTSFYNPSDHKDLSKAALQLKSPWIMTYDNVPEVKKLYTQRRKFDFELKYSLQTKRLGSEVLIASKGLKIPNCIKEGTLLRNAA